MRTYKSIKSNRLIPLGDHFAANAAYTQENDTPFPLKRNPP